ncbi:MAG TPA: multicopper oxidase domain-containing protein [Longimicrobiales bacterium]
MNRRTFLRRTIPSAGLLAVGCGAILEGCESIPSMPEPTARPLLRMPRTLDATGALLTAGAAELDLGDHASRAWGYDGSIPGPTLRARVGAEARIRLLNHLAEDTTLHWHGMVVPASMDGHPADPVASGAAFDYAYPIVQRAAMNWYHPHPHGRTGRQVWRGMAGAFILDDPVAEAGLPSGDREVPLLLRDGRLDGSGQLEYRHRSSGLIGDFPIVNGVPYPRAVLPPALHRLRVLNAANARVFRLALSDGSSFTLIGNDGGLLERPVDIDEIELAPAERVDLLVDLSRYATGDTVALRCRRAAPRPRARGVVPGPVPLRRPRTRLPVGAGVEGHRPPRGRRARRRRDPVRRLRRRLPAPLPQAGARGRRDDAQLRGDVRGAGHGRAARFAWRRTR